MTQPLTFMDAIRAPQPATPVLVNGKGHAIDWPPKDGRGDPDAAPRAYREAIGGQQTPGHERVAAADSWFRGVELTAAAERKEEAERLTAANQNRASLTTGAEDLPPPRCYAASDPYGAFKP